ncbi:MAG: DUF58 domain-containing protein, partial [Actinomycetes bacterium]
MALTGRLGLLALVAAGAVSVLVPSGVGVLLASGALLVLVAVDVALAGPVRSLRLERDGDTTVRLGEEARVRLTITNTSPRQVRGLLRDAWPPSAGAVAQRHPVDVPPGERRRTVTTLRPTRRGDRPADRVTVRSLGPLRLAGRQGSHHVPWRVRALPPFTSRKHLPSRLARLRELDGRSAVMVRGQGTEFDSLREYVLGDDVRSIDWRASARAADVMVRTWRPERDRRVLLVLDCGRTAAGRVGDAPRLDAAMDAALLLAALAARAGDRVDLLAYDRAVRARVEGVPATGLLPALVQAMAPLEATLVEPDYRGLVGTVLSRASRRCLVVLLTALDSAPVEEGLLPVLGGLTRRHQVVLASVADPRAAEMAAARGDVEAVYDAAAAERARGERRRVGEV